MCPNFLFGQLKRMKSFAGQTITIIKIAVENHPVIIFHGTSISLNFSSKNWKRDAMHIHFDDLAEFSIIKPLLCAVREADNDGILIGKFL